MVQFANLSPIIQAFLGGMLGWLVTALGASTIFFTRRFNQKLLHIMLGFAAGVMIAASFWSLLAPAIELSAEYSMPAWIPPAIGFFLGAVTLKIIDRIMPHLHIGFRESQSEGIKTSLHKSALLILAITMHNIPEGLAVGVAFGAVAAGVPAATLSGAIALAVGIAIQNFPEGIAVAMPIRREGKSKLMSFWYGQISGIVEPVSAVIGASLVFIFRPILPYALSFAAGAMIFVVVEQVIPESQHGGFSDSATMGTIVGFLVMMILDVALG
jgi:ZIP family zinc transporter|tara:strand:+ start:6951 stop:7760 length:810 start_codon:yes stop_codon:yes gene_type:complete